MVNINNYSKKMEENQPEKKGKLLENSGNVRYTILVRLTGEGAESI